MSSVDKGRRHRLAPDERRSQIIEAAGRLIADRGFWGVSVHDIASQCGITDAGVLHHFRSKERLLLAVLEHRDEADRVALSARLGVRRDDLYDAVGSIDLERLCDAMVRRNAEQPEIVRLYCVLSAEALEPPHPAHDYFLDRERVAIETFAAARSTHRGDPLRRGAAAVAAMPRPARPGRGVAGGVRPALRWRRRRRRGRPGLTREGESDGEVARPDGSDPVASGPPAVAGPAAGAGTAGDRGQRLRR